jgi:hypothetical protein
MAAAVPLAAVVAEVVQAVAVAVVAAQDYSDKAPMALAEDQVLLAEVALVVLMVRVLVAHMVVEVEVEEMPVEMAPLELFGVVVDHSLATQLMCNNFLFG